MKKLNKYLLIVTLATSSTAFVFAGPEETKPETKENQVSSISSDNVKNKQVVPVTSVASTEQVKEAEEQKQETKPEAAKPEITPKDESSATGNSTKQNPILSWCGTAEHAYELDKRINCSREERLERLSGGLKLLLNNSFGQADDKENQFNWVYILANWLKDEWTTDSSEKFSAKDVNGIISKSAKYLKQIKKENNYSIVHNLIFLNDIYKPYFIKILCPELEQELKDVKLNETSVAVYGKFGNSQFYISSSSFINIPEEKCLEIANKNVDLFKTLSLDKQLAIIASWILNEWTLDLETENFEE
jgi:hypothetical protein